MLRLQGSQEISVKSAFGAGTVALASGAPTAELLAAVGSPVATHESSSSTSPFISNIRESTISTDSLEESIHYYRDHFGFEVTRTAEMDDSAWRTLWRLPSNVRAKAALMQIPGLEIGSIRLVQFAPTSKIYAHLPHRSLSTSYGGLDMEVPDMTARFQGLVNHGHARVNAPIKYTPPNSQQMLTESVVIGPSGERLPMVIYRDIARPDEPAPGTSAYTPVLAVFQVVEDLQQEKEVYLRLGLQITRERETSIPEVNRALGLPVDTRYRAYQLGDPAQRFARPILVQFVNKRVENLSTISNPPNLGLIMTSYKVVDIGAARQRLKGTGAAVMCEPLKIANPLYGTTMALTFKHPSGAWVELYA